MPLVEVYFPPPIGRKANDTGCARGQFGQVAWFGRNQLLECNGMPYTCIVAPERKIIVGKHLMGRVMCIRLNYPIPRLPETPETQHKSTYDRVENEVGAADFVLDQ